MTEYRRELMFKVMDGDMRISPYLHHFTFYHDCDAILNWLIRNNLTGKQFMYWCGHEFNVSLMEVARYVLGKLRKEKERQAILYGRDIIPK